MRMVLEKCSRLTLSKGELFRTEISVLDEYSEINELQRKCRYKGLKMDETAKIQQTEMEKKIRREYYRRVKLIIKPELNAKNKIVGINTRAIPVINYCWKISKLRNLDRRIY